MNRICEPIRCIYCGFVIPQRIIMVCMCITAIFVCCGQRSTFTIESVTGFHNDTHRLIIYRTMEKQYFTASFFVAQIPAGIIIDRFGAKWIFIEGIALASILTCLAPILNDLDTRIVLMNGICLTIVHSVLFPAVAVILSQWAPYTQRAGLGAVTFGSYPLAIITSQIMRDVLRHHTNIYLYIWGSLGLIWCGINVFFLFETPRLDPLILDEENELLEYIEPKKRGYLKDWRVLKDLSVWALIVGQVGHGYTIILMTVGLWHYLNVKFKGYVTHTMIIQCLSTFGLMFAACYSGRISDHLIVEKGRNSKWTRRLTTYMSFIISSLFMGLMCFVDKHIVCFCIFYCIAVIFKGLHYAGIGVNYMDITFNFCSTIMGVINFCSDLCSYVLSLLIGSWAGDHYAFCYQVGVASVISLASNTVYLFLADTKRGKWDDEAGD